MGCYRGRNYNDYGSYNDYGGYNDYCVKDVVRKIVDAQRKAMNEDSHSCATSCERSIDDLLSPDRHFRPTRYSTIPFMLVCKDGCKNFVGSGFTSRRGDRDGRRHGHFRCVESPVFKVKGFKRGSDSCVNLELLEPVYWRGPRSGEYDDYSEDVAEAHHYGEHGGHSSGSFCSAFGNRRIENFRYTGVCITVDLDCFCGISCLDPINPDSMCD